MHPAHPNFPARWRITLVLAGVALLHFGIGAWVGLSVDEAHYALYAQHPALSYFDHPPLVGWLQWPLVALDAPTPVLRLLPGMLWLGTAMLVYRIAVRLQAPGVDPRAAGFWAVLALALSPLLHVLGIGLLPDTLLMFFTAALMWLSLELMQTAAPRRPGLWMALGLLLGLAGLSKYTAVLPALAVGLCVVRAQGLAVLRNRWPWLAIALALLMVLPVALWNYQNHWISFSYQAKHGAGSVWQLHHVWQFLLLQVLSYGPLLLWGWTGQRQALPDQSGALQTFFWIPFALLTVMAGGGSSLPHWTAPAWVALAPFAGIALAAAVRRGRRLRVYSLVALQGLASIALLAAMVTAGTPFATSPNPFADLHGWDAAGQRARTLAEQHQLDSVSVQNWTLASRLGWYARPLPVHVLEDRFDQFDLWAGDLPAGGRTLLVDWSQMAYRLPLGAHGFASCTLLDTEHVTRFGQAVADFRFYACTGWSGDPQPQLEVSR